MKRLLTWSVSFVRYSQRVTWNGLFLMVFCSALSVISQDGSALFFREDWAEIPQAIPITQEYIVHPDLMLSLHGPGRDSVKKSGAPYHAESYVWTGLVKERWALSLKHRYRYADFEKPGAIIRWELNGWHPVYPICKIGDGTWLIGDQSSPRQHDGWEVRELAIDTLT